MNTGALLFLIGVWVLVLGLMFWSFRKLMRSEPEHEQLPPPGSIP